MSKVYTTSDSKKYTRPTDASKKWNIEWRDGFTFTRCSEYIGYIPRSTLVEALDDMKDINKNLASSVIEFIKKYDDTETNETQGQLIMYEPREHERLQTVQVINIQEV